MTRNRNFLSWSVFALLFGLGTSQAVEKDTPVQSSPVAAKYETTQVPNQEDSADDPAFWLHPENPEKSIVIGSNKKGGVLLYNLKGKEIFHWNQTPINNVDVRYDFPFKGKKIDIVVGSSKETNGIHVFQMNKDGKGLTLISKTIKTGPSAYGVCLHKDLKNRKFYAFVTHKTGSIEQWLLADDGKGEVKGSLVRTMTLSSQTEGCVADDEYGKLYAAEEGVGLWKFDTSPDEDSDGKLVASIEKNKNLVADLEGVSLYHTGTGQGYILLSVQSKDQFAVFDRKGKNEYLLNFGIREKGTEASVDAITHTDGIDVIPTNLGPDFPMGVFMAQDDENHDAQGGLENQNFKLVPWESIASSINFPLIIDNTWNPRKPTLRD